MVLAPPIVVNVRYEAYDIYGGLGSPWGSPYANTMARGAAIKAYEKRLRRFLEDPAWRVELKALSGKRVGCHCHPQPCHVDIIVKLFLELYDPNGTMVVGEHALGKAIGGLGPESQFQRPLHRAQVRRADVPSESGEVDLGSVRSGSGWASGQSRRSQEDGGGRG